MSGFNGSGTFNISGVGLPYVSGTTISSAVANQLNTDLAAGLSNCITKDGQQAVQANIPFNNYKITQIGTATAATDAASVTNIQNATGTFLSVTGTNTIVATATPAITGYVAGMTFRFVAAGTNVGPVTINISGLGAKAITKENSQPLEDGDINSGYLVSVTYDGTNFVLQSGIGGGSGLIEQETQTATSGQTVFTLSGITYTPGINNLCVFVDGVKQYVGSSYTETNITTVTFSSGLHTGASVQFIVFSTVEINTMSSANVTYTPAGTGAVTTTVQSKLRETVSVKDFGAVGDGVVDDTAAIQAAVTAGAGKQVYIPAGTYKISTTINVSSSTYIYGDGLGITVLSATTAMTNLQPVFYANNANYVRFENFSILGNTDGTLGAGTGIHCKTGIGNEIKGVYISNTTQAGIRLEEQNTAWVDSCWLESCGRSGYTDNHGIMFYSSAGSTVANYAIKITNNTVKNSYRKGITNYGPNADIYDILIDGNTVKDSGLGNIYIGTDYSKNFTITNNYCYGGYVNMQIGALASSIISNNVLDYSTGSFNIGCFGLTSCVISGNTIKNSAACGFTFTSPAGELNIKNIFSNNVVMNSRQVTTNAPAIDLLATTNSIFDSNIVFDETAANSNYGIYENTGSDYNQITNNKILNMTNTSYRILGSNTMLLDIKAGSVFNFDSGLQVKQTSLTLVNGTNNDVALPNKTGVVRISGPTAIYTITGLTGGLLGRTIKLVNDTAYVLTLKINSGSSTAGNRFYLTGGVDKTISAYSSVSLTYVTTQGNNFWTDA